MATEQIFTELEVKIPSSSKTKDTFIRGALTVPVRPSTPRSCVVILHGFGGHRNYCYQKLLAQALAQESLGFYSLRFDFRGSGVSGPVDNESQGRTLEGDVQDVKDVTDWIRDMPTEDESTMSIVAMVGHSRGNIAMYCYVARYRARVPYLINCSSRFRAELIIEKALDANPNWIRDGGYYAHIARHMKSVSSFIPAAETRSLAMPKMGDVLDEIQRNSYAPDFLCIYGLQDKPVFVEDSAKYANHLGQSCTLELIPEADHNFYSVDKDTGMRINHNPKVVSKIVQWLSDDQRRSRFVKKYAGNNSLGAMSRFKKVDGVVNFRDLGGWLTDLQTGEETPQRIRPRFMYRSASLNTISQKGQHAIRALDIKVSFDLRSDNECHKNGIYSISGLERVHIPLGREDDLSPEQVAEKLLAYLKGVHGFLDVYEEILENGALVSVSKSTKTRHKSSFGTVFRHILERPSEPFLIHCTAGKDRTGVLAALVLMVCGVDMNTIAREYELTQFGISDKFETVVSKLQARYPDLSHQQVASLIASTYETMLRVVELIKRKYGGAEGYLHEKLGFSEQEIQKIKLNLLETIN
ncbi:protein-tyrosine phosphatase-like protein [Lipomyces oligophaga]|uniref:protein-tyrosine phosphatase-like protein n=1 Tax=Lipomyces oligophaga TaxID=45792 RepID=UPI0034CDBEC5